MSTTKSTPKAIAQRIRDLIRHLDMTKNAFATKIGHRNLTRTLKANQAPGTKMLLAIHHHYPEISLDWILTGRGSMYYANYAQEDGNLQSQETGVPYEADSINRLTDSIRELTDAVKQKL